MGGASYKNTLMKNYGVKEPCYGVKIGDMKKIQKRVKVDYQLALDLYDTGNYDAMYLAGLIADDERMTRKDLNRWARKAYGASLPGATVAGVAAGNKNGHALALEWIESKNPNVACAGWATLAAWVSVKSDEDLDIPELKRLVKRVQKEVHQAPGTVAYQMNMFVICVGSYVKPLTKLALDAGRQIGPVEADIGKNNCQVFNIVDYIRKVEARGYIGKKRKSAKC